MVGVFLFGVALLVAVLLIARWYVGADPKALAKSVKWLGLALALVVLAWLALTGKLWAAVAALPAVLMWFLRLATGLRYAQMFKRMMGLGGAGAGWSSPGANPGAGNGQGSRVRTRFVDMRLDHATGYVSGEILDGRFKGQRLEDLNVEDLLELLAEARVDPDSARVVESYLDRRDPDWRDPDGRDPDGRARRQRRGGAGAGASQGGTAATSSGMSRAEALKVLGLKDGASADEVKAAHRRLMAQVHPDHGGSDYLAQQINQAKDVLLGG